MYTSSEGFGEFARSTNPRSDCKYDVTDKQNKNA